ncbi:MAG TPA: MupA/Atu3671 family FMN-dependent luciferase-like monooxygenase [Thermoanaerobaculia bacterium]|nr:MupA/Atu3671 family FMN-dependent luciferase-like monooxygenase [Thermoanaerobaculia bacterium]
MSGLDERLKSLTPEKRRLLELRLRREAGDEAGAGSGGAARQGDGAGGDGTDGGPPAGMTFSLFFFSADGSSAAPGKYRLLLDCARFADREGFAAVWTPERHFTDFGGLYPSPAVLGAALAAVTERTEIRAGSVVLPLHHPVRVAEEWAVVDNLSGGRVGISIASGWHPADFVLRPENWEERRDVMYRDLATLRRLWAGETVQMAGGGGHAAEVRLLPRPVRPELPVWVTSSGTAATWERAGEAGANVLAQMGSQPLPDLERKVQLYRAARQRAGHDPAPGTVTLMLHTYLDEDPEAARAAARAPLGEYLRTHARQRDSFLDLPGITAADHAQLIPLAVEHYLSAASLIGSPAGCSALLGRLAAIGVDEIACLIDFGIDMERVLAGLQRLAELRRRHTVEASPRAEA